MSNKKALIGGLRPPPTAFLNTPQPPPPDTRTRIRIRIDLPIAHASFYRQLQAAAKARGTSASQLGLICLAAGVRLLLERRLDHYIEQNAHDSRNLRVAVDIDPKPLLEQIAKMEDPEQ